MKQYPSISHLTKKTNLDDTYYVFDKLDGSNVRVVVDKEAIKSGVLTKFGKRSGLLDDKTPFLIESKDLISALSKNLIRMVKDSKWEEATFFFEFYGDSSFSGAHFDETHKVSLIDIDVYKKGILPPGQFLPLAAAYDIPYARMLCIGNIDEDFQKSVEDSTVEGMTFEGVVCKNSTSTFKIKSKAWLAKLKEKCGDDEELFSKLR
jgi:hypothetical protein